MQWFVCVPLTQCMVVMEYTAALLLLWGCTFRSNKYREIGFGELHCKSSMRASSSRSSFSILAMSRLVTSHASPRGSAYHFGEAAGLIGYEFGRTCKR